MKEMPRVAPNPPIKLQVNIGDFNENHDEKGQFSSGGGSGGGGQTLSKGASAIHAKLAAGNHLQVSYNGAHIGEPQYKERGTLAYTKEGRPEAYSGIKFSTKEKVSEKHLQELMPHLERVPTNVATPGHTYYKLKGK